MEKNMFYRIAYYVSMAYYSIATEIGFINNTVLNAHKKSLNVEKSKICHLNSLRIALEYVPSLSDFTQHIHKALIKKHQIDLSESQNEP